MAYQNYEYQPYNAAVAGSQNPPTADPQIYLGMMDALVDGFSQNSGNAGLDQNGLKSAMQDPDLMTASKKMIAELSAEYAKRGQGGNEWLNGAAGFIVGLLQQLAQAQTQYQDEPDRYESLGGGYVQKRIGKKYDKNLPMAMGLLGGVAGGVQGYAKTKDANAKLALEGKEKQAGLALKMAELEGQESRARLTAGVERLKTEEAAKKEAVQENRLERTFKETARHNLALETKDKATNIDNYTDFIKLLGLEKNSKSWLLFLGKEHGEEDKITKTQLLDDSRGHYSILMKSMIDEYGNPRKGMEDKLDALTNEFKKDAASIMKGNLPSWANDVEKAKAVPAETSVKPKNITLPDNITKVSQAIDYLTVNYEMTRDEAIAWIKKNATTR